MKIRNIKHLLCVSAIMLFASQAFAQKIVMKAENPSDHIISIVSYNTHHSAGLDKKVDYERIGKVIAEMQPDVAGLQEIDSCWIRSGRVNSVERIAKAAGMEYWLFGPAIDFDGGRYGNAIISREKPLSYINIPLPGAEEKRAMLVAEFKDYFFCVTHLSLTEESRAEAIAIISEKLMETAGKSKKPLFLCGDFNDTPRSSTIGLFTGSFEFLSGLGKTFPANEPDRTLDYIMILKNKPGQKILKNFVKGKYGLASWVQPESVASDHRPISAVIIKGQSFVESEL